ncbi:MAG: hypothetical protein IKL91_03655 [Bacteroidales bacterium]|nr:hypothetical protein [Bacteroidales bacterium]
MKRSVYGILFLLAGGLLGVEASAQEADSLKTGGDRGVMLNAETASVPRDISIGLPTSDGGASICEDGVKHSYSFVKGRYHWAGGNSYETVRLRSLAESIIKTGDIGIVVESISKTGGDRVEGAFSFKTSTFGQINFDGCVSGPIRKGWYYAVGAYLNLDPTSVNAPGKVFVDNKQIFKLSLTRRWSAAELSVFYKFCLNKDSLGGYGEAPFIYNGDGSVSALDGYKIGRSCYFPADDHITYMDLMTGQMKTGHMGKMDDRRVHDIIVKGKYAHDSGWLFKGTLHGCISPRDNWAKSVLSGIDIAEGGLLKNGKEVTLADGTPYSGSIQNRVVSIVDAKSLDFTALFEAGKKWRKHEVDLGLELVTVHQYERTSATKMAHTVSADPVRLYLDDQETWGHNMNAQLVSGHRSTATVYGFHNWNITDRFFVKTGLRVRALNQSCDGAHNLNGNTFNKKTDGFHLQNGVAQITNVTLNRVEASATLYGTYRLADGLFLLGEGFYSKTNKVMSYFKTTGVPALKAIGNAMGRGGLMYQNKWMDITGMVSYITCWNCAATVSVTERINGQSETLDHTAQYGIGNLGFNMDGNLHWGGFNLHLMCTVQDPKYKNYDNTFVFSDGSTKTISYNGKYTTGISRVELEIDPSYTYKDWRFWLSARYFSRQYASRTNLAYFDGRWETFGGVDWKILPDLKLSLNVVNWLFQTGPKGSIDSVDTISDPAQLQGILMSGKYMRPFEVNLSISYKF